MGAASQAGIPNPVSYTHLDVYKRQAECELAVAMLYEELRKEAGDVRLVGLSLIHIYSRLEREPDLDDGQYAEIEDALVREKNRVLGSKFRELVQVRRRTAELKGYDNYARYSFEAVYGRDYTCLLYTS